MKRAFALIILVATMADAQPRAVVGATNNFAWRELIDGSASMYEIPQKPRAIVGADNNAWIYIGGPGAAGDRPVWEQLRWNDEDCIIRDNGRPMFCEDDAMPPGLKPAREGNRKGMLPDSLPGTAGRFGLYVNKEDVWHIYAEAVFERAKRGTREIAVVAWKVGSFRVLARSPPEPANQGSEHIISVSAVSHVGVDEVILVYVSAHDNGAAVNDSPSCPGCGVRAKGIALVVWTEP